MILGTAAYLAPEQAKGRPADKRSDLWAFGCVLYEMLTGKRAFEGEDVSDTLAAVLRGEPDWNALPAALPMSIRALLQACVAKERRQRVADISAALFVLGYQATLAAVPAPGVASSAARVPLWRRALPYAAVVTMTSAAAGYLGWVLRPDRPGSVSRFAITLSAGETFRDFSRGIVDVSPDGARLTFVANDRLSCAPSTSSTPCP